MARVDKKTAGRGRHKGGGAEESLDDLLREAKSRMEVGKYGKAASALKKLLGRAPDHWEALRLSASLNLKLGSLFAARSSFESLARKAFERQDHLIAQSLLKEYLAVVPRYIPFLELLGQALEASGNLSGAVVEYGKALSFIQESDDAEQKERGPKIYERVKALDPDGPIVKRLADVYEPQIASPGEGTPPIPATPSPVSPQAPPPRSSDVAAESGKPWASTGEPAPFPWEVPPGAPGESRDRAPASTVETPAPMEPPASVDVDHKEDSASTPVAPSEPPSGGLTFATETAGVPGPEMSAVEPEAVSAEPAATDLTASHAPADTPVTTDAVEGFPAEHAEEPPAVADITPVEEPQQEPESSLDHTVAEPLPPPAIEEPPPEPESRGFFGFRFSRGSIEPVEETTAEAAAEPAVAEESAEPPALGFTQPADDLAPDQRLEPAPELEPVQEPSLSVRLEPEASVETAEPPPPTRRSRRRAADQSTSSAAAWSSASGAGDSQALPPVRLFPTAAKLQVKATLFVRRVFSAVWSFTVLILSLATGCGVLALLAVAGVSLLWIGTEEKPSNAFYNLMKVPTPPLLDRRQNGYLKLMAIGDSASRKPLRMGEGRTVASGDPSQWPEGFADLAAALSAWYGAWDPAREFRNQRTVVRQWSAFFGALMAKYHGWVGSRIEDVGYGRVEAPDEALILGIHRLYVAEGFSGGVERGLERLQRDAETWRKALEEAKTLRFKLLAVEALTDDLIVMSGLLSKPDLDLRLLPTMARMSRPLDNPERSLRWPMQNQFGLEMELTRTYLRSGEEDTRPPYIKALTFLPVPKQKVFNAHANYYEALAKHDSLIKVEGDPRKNMPLRYTYLNAPPKTLSDYMANPIDTLLVQEDRVDWHDVIGRIVETEARLRLGSLQTRIRRPPATADALARIADAGQDFYDPFTGFTMLMDGSKTILYSVGRDGQDNDGDPTLDVSVPLFPQSP